ncbi:DUF362 domain-containing protein [bacterium]|nr:DUF362 domain-containing protein [bacterium]
MDRRDFLKKTASTAGLVCAGSELASLMIPTEAGAVATGGGIDIEEGVWMLESGKERNVMPQIRPEILNNPRAVFLIETHVSGSPDPQGFFTDSRDQIYETGKKIVPDIFVKGSTKGGSTFIKMNYTWIPDNSYSPVTGVITSSDFAAGFVEGLREIGNTNVMLGDRGGTNIRNHRMTGIYNVMDAHNINVMMPTYERFSHYNKNELNWHKVPKPVVWNTIPTYRPLGDPDNMFINMPKLKNHYLTGTTLSVKNLQGSVPTGYGHYCNEWAELDFLIKNVYMINPRHFTKDWRESVEAAFLKHREAGFKYWDYEGAYKKYEAEGGRPAFDKIRENREAVREFMKEHPYLMRDELWTQRALDSASAIKPTINIVEGVIGRDGDGFSIGKDELCNIVIAGLSTFETDVIGSYIMGQNPQELWFTRVMKERGLAECDPEKIDVYFIRNGEVTPVKNLAGIRRYKLGCNIHAMLRETGKRLFW